MTATSVVARGQALARSVLDRTRPADEAARLAVDAALARKSTDRAVHAAALRLAFAADADLGLERSQAKHWAFGLDELIDCGHLEAAAYAAPRLRAAYPRMPYLTYMDLVFRRLPPPAGNGRQLFVDDRGSDVQTVVTPGAETVVVAFCGIGNRLGLSVSLMDRWLARLDSHVIYLRDRRRIGFTGGVPALGPDLATTVGSVTRLVRDLGGRRVVCIGNSAGGAGALRYARPLGADRVLALAPITGGPDFVRKVAPDLPPDGDTPWTDLVPLYRDDGRVRVRILFGENNESDREQSLRMAGLPNVTVEAVPDWDSHHLVGGLLRAGRLEHVLSWLTSGEDRLDFDAVRSG